MKMSVMCVCALTPELPFIQEELEIAKPTIITGMHTEFAPIVFYYILLSVL